MKFASILCILDLCSFIRSKNIRPYSASEYEAGRRAGLARHNLYRSWYGMPKMKLNDRLNTRAAQWAKLVVNKQRSGHSPKEWRKLDGQQVGENVYTYWNNHPGLQPNISEQFENAVDNWYYEICDDKQYPKRNFQGDVNLYHDTQVLWRSSREIGMGIAVNRHKGWTYVEVVAHYAPAGNWIGEGDKNLNGLKPICHTEYEICNAHNDGDPLEFECHGALWNPADADTFPQQDQVQEENIAEIEEPDKNEGNEENYREHSPMEEGNRFKFQWGKFNTIPLFLDGGFYEKLKNYGFYNYFLSLPNVGGLFKNQMTDYQMSDYQTREDQESDEQISDEKIPEGQVPDDLIPEGVTPLGQESDKREQNENDFNLGWSDIKAPPSVMRVRSIKGYSKMGGPLPVSSSRAKDLLNVGGLSNMFDER